MAISRVKTWSAGEVLLASELNSEFDNIINGGVSIWSPATAAVDFDGQTITLDAAAATTVASSAAVSWNFTSGAKSGTPATTGSIANWSAQTFTDSATAASGTATAFVAHGIQRPTLAATNASVTTTDAATLYIANAPAAGTNETITNPWAVWVDAGAVRLDGALRVDGTLTGAAANFSGDATLGDAITDAHTINGSATINVPAGSVGLILKGRAADDIATFQFATNGGTQTCNLQADADLLKVLLGSSATEVAQFNGTSGDFKWGTGGYTRGLIVKRKTADESVTSSTTLQNDDHLTFSIAANEEWVVDVMLDIGDALSTTGVKLAITAPSGATADMNLMMMPGTSDIAGHTTTPATGFDSGAASHSSTFAIAHVSYWVLNGANAGSITLQFAQSTSSGSAVTLRKGSRMIAHRVA